MKLAGCIILDDQGRILLMHRNTPERVQWEIPGGCIDPGETPDQTAIRELAEELDVAVELVNHLGTKAFTEDEKEHEYHWFHARITERAPRLAEPDMYDDLRYFEPADLHTMMDSLSANTKNFADAIKSGQVVLPLAS